MVKKAIILAGGKGTRLQPVTLEIPKPLVTVQGVPILTWLVRLFLKYGVEDITVIYPTYWKKAFERWNNEMDCEITLFEETEPMGTMGAIVHELELGSDPIFVTNGDELKGLNLSRLAQFHDERVAADQAHGATIALVRVPNPSEYGVAEIEGDYISKFHEKPENPPTDLISSGIYILSPNALTISDKTQRFLMFEKNLFPKLAKQKRLAGCQIDGQWFDCGTMQRWEAAINEWRGLDETQKLV